jgi:hypothetical protein
VAQPGYTYLTLAEARAQLSTRLEDPSFVYWQPAELNALIVEAIRTWQALTNTFKQRAEFTITRNGGIGGSSFYDLNSILPNFQFSFTDLQLLQMTMAALLEPPLTPDWVGTGQFLFSQIQDSLQNRINEWLGDTGANVTRNVQTVDTGPTGARVFLPESVLDVRRAAWANQRGVYSTLWRDDEFAQQAFRFGGNLTPADPPVTWAKFVIPPVGIEVYPIPANPGQLETLVVDAGPQIGPDPATIISSPTVLAIPEDFVWGIVFGALSDLCSNDGPMRDLDRSQYAESRYQESVELYKLNPTLLMSQIDGVQVWTGSVFEMDAFLASWQAKPDEPRFVGMAGRNLVAFGPTPSSTHSVVVDVVGNIPLPVSDSDFLQVDRGAINPLLDYAQHLASWKMAGVEFHNTDKLRVNFYRQAALENQRITQGSFYRSAMQLPAFRQQQEVPRINSTERQQGTPTQPQQSGGQ